MKDDLLTTEYGEIPSDWQVRHLRDVCVPDTGVQTGPFGSQLHQRDYQAFGTPIITVEHLGENRIIHLDLPRVSDSDRQRLSRYDMRVGDIIFSRVGSVDRRSLVREEEDGWLFSGRCLRVRPNTDVVSAEYLSWFFGLPAFKEHIRAIAVGATMPSINTEILSGVQVILPSLPEQRAIARVLGTLDNKIELNRRMNHTLESMAQALFKSWFIDFDPVIAKSEGRQLCGMNAETARLFPSKFQDSELGAIPSGWSVGKLEDLLVLQRGFDLPTPQRTLGRYPVLAASGYSGTHNEFKVKGPGVTTGRSGVIGKVFFVHEDYWPLNTSLWVRDFKLAKPVFAYHLLKTLDFETFNAGSAVPTLNRNHVHNLPVIVPPDRLIDSFEKISMPLFRRSHQNELESHTLTSIRDVLLPKLFSGKIRMKV